MLRKTMLALGVLALFGLAAAQTTASNDETIDPPTTIIINPTLSSGNDVIAKALEGENDMAVVSQTVVLELPKATALHLAASAITFDLSILDGESWEEYATGDMEPPAGAPICVYVSGDDYLPGNGFWGQPQAVPGGIAYDPVSWDKIKLIYLGNGKTGDVHPDELVVTYPPIRIGSDGKLVEGSKDYFVCYQSFVIQLFSNFENFQLQVSRADLTPQGIEHLYVQGNTCAEFGTPTGLYPLDDGAELDLLPLTLTYGPTGSRNTSTCNPNSSWMDMLGVLAVKVNADLYGTNTADLKYTLISSDDKF